MSSWTSNTPVDLTQRPLRMPQSSFWWTVATIAWFIGRAIVGVFRGY